MLKESVNKINLFLHTDRQNRALAIVTTTTVYLVGFLCLFVLN